MSDSPLVPNPAALRHHRAMTISRLCDHFANDHLDADELQELIDRAHHAQTLAALDDLVVGLPVLAASAVPARSTPHPVQVEERQFVIAIVGGTERKGPWIPARNISVIATMGGSVLDFREARLGPGVTNVYAFALMGGVEIIVPPGLRVESNGVGIMGGFEHTAEQLPDGDDGPVLRVSGLAIMGGVEITEKVPKRRKPTR